MAAPQELADTLVGLTPPEYVRFVAHWMLHASDLDQAADLTGVPEIDALVAAAAAQVAADRGEPVASWTNESTRFVRNFWYPGPGALFPNALVHSPQAFFLHGVLVERDSLVSV